MKAPTRFELHIGDEVQTQTFKIEADPVSVDGRYITEEELFSDED